MLQQLLEMGLKNLRREALTNFGKKYAKKTTTTKPKRSSCLPRFNTRERILSCTIDNDTEAETLLSTWGRTSTVSRKTNTSKLKETHSGQVTLSTSTQMNRPAYETGVISRRSERDQDGSSFPTRTDRDSLSASAGRPFSAGSSLNSQKSTGSSSTTRPAPSTGVTSGKSERDQDGNGSSFPTRTGRDGQSASAGRPFSAGPRLKSKKSTGSSKSKTDSLDGGSVGHTKNPPQIKPSLFSQEQEHCLIMLQHHEGISSIVQTSVPKQDTVPVECQDENLLCSFGVGSIHVTVLCGDILRERSCGIVNAANGSLMHAAGVAGIIARAAGPEMELECENFISMRGSLRTTEVMHTSAGGQFSREVTHILHAVGPIWIGETFKDKFYYELTKTFMNCLIYANDKLGLESLTLPLISSGIFGAPLDECVRCFLDGLLVYSKQETKTRHLKKVHLIFKDPDSTMLCIAILQQLLDNGIENLTKEALEMYSEHEIRNSEKARLLDSKDWTRYKYT